MALNDDLVMLQETLLFSELTEDALRLLAFGAEHRHISQGDTLYRQGDAAYCAYVVISGMMQTFRETGDKDPVLVATLKRGSLMGEIALIMPTERQFSVKAVEHTQLMQINRDLFHRLLAEYPSIAGLLRRRIQQNLDQLTTQLSQLGKKFHP